MRPNDLTTVADLKAWLGIASVGDDAMLAALVSDISAAILADCGRATIRPTVYTECHDGRGARAIVLRQWPVAAVLSVLVDGSALAAGSAVSLEAASPAPAGGLQRLSLAGGSFPPGAGNIVVTYRAGYEIGGEAAMVPLSAPYALAAAAPSGAWTCDGAVATASGSPLQAAAIPAAGSYAVAGGTYTFAAADAGAALVLRYGYVPADLARACCEWAADRYAARGRIGQSARTLGGQETTSFVVKAMPDFVARLLQPYRRVAVP